MSGQSKRIQEQLAILLLGKKGTMPSFQSTVPGKQMHTNSCGLGTADKSRAGYWFFFFFFKKAKF